MAWRAASYAKPGFPRSRHHNRFLDARDDCILLSRASVCLLPCTLGKHTMYIQCSLITTHHHRGSAHATPPDLAITVDTAVARLLTVRQEAPVRGVVLRLSTSATLPLCRRRHVIAPRWKFLLGDQIHFVSWAAGMASVCRSYDLFQIGTSFQLSFPP